MPVLPSTLEDRRISFTPEERDNMAEIAELLEDDDRYFSAQFLRMIVERIDKANPYNL